MRNGDCLIRAAQIDSGAVAWMLHYCAQHDDLPPYVDCVDRRDTVFMIHGTEKSIVVVCAGEPRGLFFESYGEYQKFVKGKRGGEEQR